MILLIKAHKHHHILYIMHVVKKITSLRVHRVSPKYPALIVCPKREMHNTPTRMVSVVASCKGLREGKH